MKLKTNEQGGSLESFVVAAKFFPSTVLLKDQKYNPREYKEFIHSS